MIRASKGEGLGQTTFRTQEEAELVANLAQSKEIASLELNKARIERENKSDKSGPFFPELILALSEVNTWSNDVVPAEALLSRFVDDMSKVAGRYDGSTIESEISLVDCTARQAGKPLKVERGKKRYHACSHKIDEMVRTSKDSLRRQWTVVRHRHEWLLTADD